MIPGIYQEIAGTPLYEEANDIICSVMFKILGEIPFAAVMQQQDGAREIWAALRSRYVSGSTFSKVIFCGKLAMLNHHEEKMNKFLSQWDAGYAQLAAAGSPLDKTLLISMFFE